MTTKTFIASLAIVAAAVAPKFASADGADGYDGPASRVSFGASSFGPTIEGAFRLGPQLAFRGVAGGLLDLTPTVTLDGRDYDTVIEPRGVGALFDLYPGGHRFRVTGGVYYTDLRFSGTTTTTAADAVVIGGTTLGVGETVTLDIDPKRNFAPVMSIGYDQPLGERWILSGEAGAVFNNGFNVRVTETSGIIPQADLDAEAQNIESDLDSVNLYPYVSIMIGVRF